MSRVLLQHTCYAAAESMAWTMISAAAVVRPATCISRLFQIHMYIGEAKVHTSARLRNSLLFTNACRQATELLSNVHNLQQD